MLMRTFPPGTTLPVNLPAPLWMLRGTPLKAASTLYYYYYSDPTPTTLATCSSPAPSSLPSLSTAHLKLESDNSRISLPYNREQSFARLASSL